ncbi:MAG: hypothetical protein CMM41_03060 [Rhodospirillaceae bacterium]|nr:hypothetical protein [Rhodospirillaceae bacterium]
MVEPQFYFIVGATFFLAGLTKGVIGLGLPTVSLAVLTAFFGLKDAIPLILIPSLVTNLLQAFSGPHLKNLIKRFWSLLLAGVTGIFAVSEVFANSSSEQLSLILGISIIIYSGFGLSSINSLNLTKREKWYSPIVGIVTGAFTGLTGSFVVPAVPYLQSLGLTRDQFIQAMGIWFSVATGALAVMLGIRGLLPMDQNIISTAALLPAVIGMSIGQVIRRRLSEIRFRRMFFFSLLFMGIYIIVGPTQ